MSGERRRRGRLRHDGSMQRGDPRQGTDRCAEQHHHRARPPVATASRAFPSTSSRASTASRVPRAPRPSRAPSAAWRRNAYRPRSPRRARPRTRTRREPAD